MIGAVHEITIMHALAPERLAEGRAPAGGDGPASAENGRRGLTRGGLPALARGQSRGGSGQPGLLSGIITRSDLMRFYERAGH